MKKFNRISHAYIVDESLSTNVAIAAVCELNNSDVPCQTCVHCNKASRGIHPDIEIISKPDDKRIISVDQVRELKKEVYILPNEASRKVYIIKNAELMNEQAQNALLKVLEEPPSFAVFILSTANPLALLQTIRSRSIILLSKNIDNGFDNSDNNDIIDDLIDNLLYSLNKSRVELMKCMFQIEKLDRGGLESFLQKAREKIFFYYKTEQFEVKPVNKIHISPSQLIDISECLTRAEEMLNANVNAGHIAGMICAGLLRNEA